MNDIYCIYYEKINDCKVFVVCLFGVVVVSPSECCVSVLLQFSRRKSFKTRLYVLL